MKELVQDIMKKFAESECVNIQGYSLNRPSDNEDLLVLWITDDKGNFKTFRITSVAELVLSRGTKVVWHGTTDTTGKKLCVFIGWMNEETYCRMLGIDPEESRRTTEEILRKLREEGAKV